jgi:hypothetical protein
MRFYLDTEFNERGPAYPIELISIGIVREDGREFYGVLSDGWDEAHCNGWVRANVLPHLGPGKRLSRADAARAIVLFCGEKPEFIGYFADYDWVVLCQLFGTMMDLPKGWPMFCRDVKQWCCDVGNPKLPRQSGTAHNALDDARHIREMHRFLETVEANRNA